MHSSSPSGSSAFDRAKHLAQEFLDGELGGTDLEGGYLESTLAFMSTFLTRMQPRNYSQEDPVIVALVRLSLTPTICDNLSKLMASMTSLNYFQARLETEVGLLKKSGKAGEELEKMLQPVLQKLGKEILTFCEKRNEVFLAGGWTGIPGRLGHQMIYRLTFKGDEAFFYAYNTGSGINYHGSAPLPSGKQGYYPVYAFQFKRPEDRNKLICFLAQLLEPQAMPRLNRKRFYTAEEVYEDILRAAMWWLNGFRLTEDKLPKPILAQRNGVCVRKALAQMTQAYFDSREAYRLFLLAYRLFLLNENIVAHTLAKTERELPGYQNLLRGCVANTARMLDVRLKPEAQAWSLSAALKADILRKFSAWNNELAKDLRVDGSGRIETLNPDEPQSTVTAQAMAPSLPGDIAAPLPGQQTDEKAQACLQRESRPFVLAVKNLSESQDDDELFCRRLEQFCCDFSRPKRALVGTQPVVAEFQDLLLTKMEGLLKRYSRCRPEPTARAVWVYVSLMYLMDRLCETGVFRGQNLKLSCLPLSADIMTKPFILRLVSNPFLATFDPEFDLLVQRIRKFYLEMAKKYPHQTSNDLSFEGRCIKYYCSILEDAPEEEKAIIKGWWTADKEDKQVEALVQKRMAEEERYGYSFLTMKGQLRRGLTPVLDKNFKRQERIEKFLKDCLSPIAALTRRGDRQHSPPALMEKQALGKGEQSYLTIQSYPQQVEKHLFLNSVLFEWAVCVKHEEVSLLGGYAWVLKPAFLSRHFPLKNALVRNALTAHYDGNPYSSVELPFNRKTSTFMERYFVPAAQRQHTERRHVPPDSRSSEDRLGAFLQLLRISSRSQALLLLSELARRPDWLADDELQQYVELSIFQPQVLLFALESGGASLAVLLENLLKLNRFNHDPAFPEKAEWFVLKLAAKISGYALLAAALEIIKLNESDQQAFAAWHEKMLEVLAVRLAKPQVDLADRREAYHLRLFSLLSGARGQNQAKAAARDLQLLETYLALMFLPQTEQAGSLLEEERSQVLMSAASDYFAGEVKTEPAVSADPAKAGCPPVVGASKAQEDGVRRAIAPTTGGQPALAGSAEALIESALLMVPRLLEENGKGDDWRGDLLQSKFPVLVLENKQGARIKIDLLSRSIKENEQTLCYLPLSVRLQPEYRELFGAAPILTMKTTFEHHTGFFGPWGFEKIHLDCHAFVHQGQAYRVLYDQDNKSVYFQKKIDGQWHSLMAPTPAMAAHLGYSHAAFTQTLPRLFEQATFRVWAASEQVYRIEDFATRQLCYERKEKTLLKFEASGAGKAVTMAGSPSRCYLPPFLFRLESGGFIEEEVGNDSAWRLPRYGLVFRRNNSRAFVLEDKQGRYTVEVPQGRSDLFETGVILRSQDQDKEDLYLVPLQPFYQASEAKCDKKLRPVWIHDFSDQVTRTLLAEDLQYSKDQSRGWTYSGGERQVRFIWKDGQATSSNAADQIYLAYLHLAKDHPGEALTLLRNCQFQGSVDEIERLWWLVTKLPANARQPFNNSAVVAVQMQALYVLARLKNQFPLAAKLAVPAGACVSDTDYFRRAEMARLQDYLDQLNRRLEEHYCVYDNRRNNIPRALRLNELQEQFILSCCQLARNQQVQDRQAGHEQKDDEEELKAEANGGRSTLLEYHGVAGTRYLEHFPVPEVEASLVLYSDKQETLASYVPSFDLSKLSNEVLKEMKRDNEAIPRETAMKELSPWMSLESLLRNFPVYYIVALEPDSKEKTELLRFCEALIIRSYREQDQSNLASAAINLGGLLWGLCKVDAKAVLPKKWSEHEQERSADPAADALAFIRLIKSKFDSLILRHPALMLPFTKEKYKIHRVYPKALVPVPLPPPVLAVKPGQEDPFVWGLGENLKTLRGVLQKEEEAYGLLRAELLEKLKALPGLPLARQIKLFKEIDEELLLSLKGCQEKQAQSLLEAKLSGAELESLKESLSELKAKQNQARARMGKIVERRQIDWITEYGGQQEAPTVDSLIADYAKATPAVYQAMGIHEADQKLLEEALQEVFLFRNAEQRLEEYIKVYQGYLATPSSEAQKKLIAALLRKNAAGRKHERLFQYMKELTLNPEQVALLDYLAESDPGQAASYVLQLIMGGGKTKILLPLLLYFLAHSGNSPVVMIPDMLLNSCFADLRATSMSTLNQDAFLFQFDREAASDPASLQYLFETMQTAFAQHCYLVTSPSAVQSLELKYLEILFYRNHPEHFPGGKAAVKEREKETEEQLLWLEKILDLWSEATLVPDEVHQIFHIPKELNYGLGGTKALSPYIVETVVELFSWMSERKGRLQLKSLVQNPNSLADDKAMDEIMEYYINALGEEKEQPEWSNSLLFPPLQMADFQRYLRGDKAEEERINVLLSAYPLLKARWVLLREEFLTYLRLTLREKLHEKYGADLGPDPKRHAIVYRANNVPTVFEFSYMETINYTCQMMYCDGVPLKFFKDTLALWQYEARQARQASPGAVSAGERLFNFVFANEKLSLLSLDFNDGRFIASLHEKHKNNSLLVREALKDSLLRLRLDVAILRSDSLNLASMFKRIYAFSATPSNHRSYHPKLKMLYEWGLLIESRVKDHLLVKKTPVKEYKAETPEAYLECCVTEDPKARVLLDRGSHLRGLSNLEVVQKLAVILKKHRPALLYLLFYLNDVPFVWDLKQDDGQLPRKLSSTDPDVIQQELQGCPPDLRFTYKDQEHTLGLDILQDDEAVAVLTADLDTGLSDFLQAAMRMRALGQGQKIVVVVDALLMEKINQSRAGFSSDLACLFEILDGTQQKKMQAEHFPAALKTINNNFRADLLLRLRRQPRPFLRDQLFLRGEKFFIEYQSDDIVALYAQKREKQKTKTFLKAYAKRQLQEWRSAAGVGEEKRAGIAAQLKSATKSTYKQAILICAPEQDLQLEQTGRQLQKQQQTKKQVKSQKAIEHRAAPNKKPMVIGSPVMTDELIRALLSGSENVFVKRLANLLSAWQVNWALDCELQASTYYLYTFMSQEKDKIFTPYSQTGVFLLFTLQPGAPSLLTATLICPEEAGALNLCLPKLELPSTSWLTTMNGTALTKAPELKEQEQLKFDRLIEQAAFISGRTDILGALPGYRWLMERSATKLEFLREVVKPAFGVSDAQFNLVQIKLYQFDELVERWAKYPSRSLDSFWLSSVPEDIKARFEKLLACLTETRAKAGDGEAKPQDLNQLSEQGLCLPDALLVVQYQGALLFLKQLKKKNYPAAAVYLKENYARLSNGVLDYHLDDGPVPLTEETCQVLVAELADQRAAGEAWIELAVTSNVNAGILSFSNLKNYLATLKNENERGLLCMRILSAKAKISHDLTSVYEFVEKCAALLAGNPVLIALRGFSRENFQNRELVLMVLTDSAFCGVVHKLSEEYIRSLNGGADLDRFRKRREPILNHLLNEWKENHVLVKQQLDTTLDFILANEGAALEACLKAVGGEAGWFALSYLRARGAPPSFAVRALYDPDLHACIQFFIKNGVDLGNISGLPEIEKLFSVWNIVRQLDLDLDTLFVLMKSESFRDLVLLLKQHDQLSEGFLNSLANFDMFKRANFRVKGELRVAYLINKGLFASDPKLSPKGGLYDTLYLDHAWSLIEALEAAKLDSAEIVKRLLLEPRFAKFLSYLSQRAVFQARPLEASLPLVSMTEISFEDIESILRSLDHLDLSEEIKISCFTNVGLLEAMKVLRASQVEDPGLWRLAATNPDFREVLKALAAAGIAPVAPVLNILKIHAAHLRLLVVYCDQKILTTEDDVLNLAQPEIWSALEILSRVPSSEPALLELARRVSADRNLQYIILSQPAEKPLQVTLLQKRLNQLHLLEPLRRHLDKDEEVLSAFESDAAWAAVTTLYEARRDDQLSVQAAVKAPSFQGVLRVLSAKGFQGARLTQAVLDLCRDMTPEQVTFLIDKDLLKPGASNPNFEIKDFKEALEDFRLLEEKDPVNALDLRRPGFSSILPLLKQRGLIGQAGLSAFLCSHLDCLSTVSLSLKLLDHHHLLTGANLTQLSTVEVWGCFNELIHTDPVIRGKRELVQIALTQPDRFQENLTLAVCNLDLPHLKADLRADAGFRAKVIKKCRAPYSNLSRLTPWSTEAIKALSRVRASYSLNPAYAAYLDSINAFTREAITVILDNNEVRDVSLAKKNILTGLSAAAETHFKHRHLAARVLADCLLVLSGLGIIYLASRKYSGQTFFLSIEKTKRQRLFEEALPALPARPAGTA